MLAFMGYAMLAAAAFGAAAWLIDFAVAGRFGRRRLLWAVVLFASAVGPIVFSLTRGVPSALVSAEDVGTTADIDAAAATSGRKEPIVSDHTVASAWLAASAIVALWLVATQHRLRRRLRGCPSRIVDGEQVLLSPHFGPAVIGVLRPQIVLPEWALATRASDRRIIVAHEAEHRQAHDPLLAAAALIVVAALPWNAALWWQLRRLRLAIEIDCDRRVVSKRGHDPHAYGLLLLAAREHASHVAPAMAMAAMRSGLGRRVEALLDGRPRSAVRRLGAVATAGLLAAGIVSVPAPQLSMVRAVADTPVVVASSRVSAGGVPAPEIRVIGSSIRVFLPRTEGAGERRDLHGRSASTPEQRRDTMQVGSRRILRSSDGSYRVMLLPGSDALPPPTR
ncbi:MAG TPA: M56 family metallopeptidase [Gemmatimonadaceae bacterium]|nr:M56 family metallopeptidase [Gemmatimonadaceae bacterium]